MLPGPQFASTYVSPGDPSDHELTYGRFHNPTWSAWENALGTLDDGQRTWRTQHGAIPGPMETWLAHSLARDAAAAARATVRVRAHAEAFLARLSLVREATSFGGVHSIAERRARWGGDAIGEGFIRFSVGCEHADDILDDVGTGLAAVG